MGGGGTGGTPRVNGLGKTLMIWVLGIEEPSLILQFCDYALNDN